MPSSANLAVNMGTGAYRQGEFEGALHYYRKAEAHQGTLSSTFRSRLLSNIGITNALLGQPGEARRYVLAALDENPRNQMALGHLLAYCGASNVDTGRFSAEDVARASATEGATAELLASHQPELQAEHAFCPEARSFDPP